MPAATSTTERHDQPAMAASLRRSGPPAGHHRAAGGDATTTAPPLPEPECNEEVLPLGLAQIFTNLRRGRPETVTVHLCILRNAACATPQR